MTPSHAAIVLAAGKGTRMKSALPKVLHPIAGRPMVHHVLQAATDTGASPLVTIIGHGAETVEEAIHQTFPHTRVAVQEQQLGTGHAVLTAKEALAGFNGDVLIVCGDVPLVDADLLRQLLATHHHKNNTLTVLTTTVADPTGLGRIIRDGNGRFSAIIEHKDATDTQRETREINTGIYAVKCPLVFELLAHVGNKNAAGEYYLTDIVALAGSQNLAVGTHHCDAGLALLGVNSRAQLAMCEGLYQQKRRTAAMDGGATLLDPQTTYFAWDTTLGQDVTIGPNTTFKAGVTVGNNVAIEGNSILANCTVADDAQILGFCHIDGAVLGKHTRTGPFARLRPGTVLADEAHVGNFCELKKASLGKGSKMGHLSYAGDSTIGSGVNIGAGTITCNYDGVNKHTTHIGDGAFIGSHTALVAPVSVGAGSFIAAGSTITKDIPAGDLAVARTRQTNKTGYGRKFKKGA